MDDKQDLQNSLAFLADKQPEQWPSNFKGLVVEGEPSPEQDQKITSMLRFARLGVVPEQIQSRLSAGELGLCFLLEGLFPLLFIFRSDTEPKILDLAQEYFHIFRPVPPGGELSDKVLGMYFQSFLKEQLAGLSDPERQSAAHRKLFVCLLQPFADEFKSADRVTIVTDTVVPFRKLLALEENLAAKLSGLQCFDGVANWLAE